MMQNLGQYSKRFLSFRKTQAIIQFTRTLTSAKLNDTLHSRVMAVENRFPFLWRVKVTPVLNEWLKQGNEINPTDLRAVIKALCESQRFDHALQVSEWITKRGVFEISTEDVASRLYLIEIHSGLSEAENFFKSIPENMKDDLVYTTLLSFYTKDKETRHEAEATYQKMRENNMLFKPNPYYKMISLYGLLGETNKVDEILRQMIENGVQHDITLTSNNVLKAYASVPDVEAMEKFLKRIEYEMPPFALAWQTGISMARAYLKCGSNRKAIEMLRRTEQVVDAKSKDVANKVLMEMYGEAGAKRDEARLYISQNAKQRQRKGACRCKGSGGRSSHHPGYYYGGCGGGCGSIRGGGDGSRADDNGGGDDSRADDDGGGDGTRADDNGGGVGADNDGDGGGGCGGCGTKTGSTHHYRYDVTPRPENIREPPRPLLVCELHSHLTSGALLERFGKHDILTLQKRYRSSFLVLTHKVSALCVIDSQISSYKPFPPIYHHKPGVLHSPSLREWNVLVAHIDCHLRCCESTRLNSLNRFQL
ncbi:hypothetical protein YC2023_109553 [Brassica napus]